MSLAAVFDAPKEKRNLRFDCRSLDRSGHALRTADPCHAVCHRGNWYLIGFCHERGEPRFFSFSRIKNAKQTKQTFVIPPDFRPETYKEMGAWASARTPHTMELLVDKEIQTYALDRRWHSTQTVQPNDDGSVYVSFTTTRMSEVFRWVLGQGSTVKVPSPAELADMVKNECANVGKMHGWLNLQGIVGGMWND